MFPFNFKNEHRLYTPTVPLGKKLSSFLSKFPNSGHMILKLFYVCKDSPDSELSAAVKYLPNELSAPAKDSPDSKIVCVCEGLI